jgi:hypothetical protein
VLASVFTVFGASQCFLLSKAVGASLKYHPVRVPPLPCVAFRVGIIGGVLGQLLANRVAALEDRVATAKARFFPFTPNWLLNMASPWVRS